MGILVINQNEYPILAWNLILRMLAMRSVGIKDLFCTVLVHLLSEKSLYSAIIKILCTTSGVCTAAINKKCVWVGYKLL